MSELFDTRMVGVIERVSFGLGGYQDAMFGLNLVFKAGGYGVSDFINGGWVMERTDSCKWTEQDRRNQRANMCELIIKTLKEAKVDEIYQLKGKPVEIITDGNCLKSWRILTEAIL